MTIYSTPIISAIVVLFFIGLFTIIPWLIYNYRKYGYLSSWTTIVVFSFIFYALSAYFLVILPLPDVRDTCAMQGPDKQYFQLIPFYFIYEMVQQTDVTWTAPATYMNLIRHGSFLTAFLNVLILFPLGVYLKYFFREKFTIKRMILIGFSVSLFFEVTQITGLYGIYTCPYRLFDVDDLILNTVGSVFGFVIAPIILAIFPSQKNVEEKSARVFKEGTVRPLPQLLAIVVDYIIVNIAWTVVSMILMVNHPIVQMLFILIGMFVLQFIMPLATKGRTIGTMMLRFEIAPDGSKRYAMLKRWFALMLPWFTFQTFSIVSRYGVVDMNSSYYALSTFIQVGFLLLMLLIIFVLVIHILIVLVRKRRHRFYFDDFSGVVSRYMRDK